MNTIRYDAIIVGAGHNGLVTAFYLARVGFRVVMLERRSFVGGACATEELFDGYRVSSCSYIMYMLQPKVIVDMELERYGLHYQSLDPLKFLPFQERSYLFLWKDTERTQKEMARLNSHDAKKYPAYENFQMRAAKLTQPFVLRDPPSLEEITNYAKSIGEVELLEQLLKSSPAEIADQYFEDERVKAAAVSVEDIGDPWTPGGAWAQNYFQALGYWIVTGGMGGITQAMARAVQAQGVEIHTDTTVDQIIVKDGCAVGVRLSTGRELFADIVISNADPKRTFLGLLGPDDLPAEFRRKVEALSTRTSYLKFHAIMDRLPDVSGYLGREAEPREVCYIRITKSLESHRRAYEDMKRGEPSREPTPYIQIPTVYDRTLTRREGHVLSIWSCYAPPKLAKGTWEERREEVGNALIDYVTEYIPNFRKDMRKWLLFTPYDLEQRVGLTDGNIRHLDTISDQLLDRRPILGFGYGSPIQGLYLCGAGTHPGGEVTGAPGHNAAHHIIHERSKLTK